MKRIFKRSVLIIVFCLLLVFSGGFTVSAKVVYDVDDRISGIIDFNLKNDGSGNVESWISQVLPGKIGGTAEWYVLGISQYPGYKGKTRDRIADSLDIYRRSLEEYLDKNEIKNATARLKFGLALAASGACSGTGSAPGNNPGTASGKGNDPEAGISAGEEYITGIMSDGTIGGLGIMSLTFGLHLVNNGFIYRDGSAPGQNGSTGWEDSRNILIGRILDEQHKDGGWSVIGD